MFLRSKDQTFEVLLIFAKQVQVRLNRKSVGTRLDHRIEFENTRVEDFCT